MNSHELIANGMEITQSLAIAIDEAGGHPSSILCQLKKMTAWDLLECLSTNNIRFKYEEREDG